MADDDHFVPPSEIDLPSAETDPMFWAIVGGLAGGPLLLLYVPLLRPRRQRLVGRDRRDDARRRLRAAGPARRQRARPVRRRHPRLGQRRPGPRQPTRGVRSRSTQTGRWSDPALRSASVTRTSAPRTSRRPRPAKTASRATVGQPSGERRHAVRRQWQTAGDEVVCRSAGSLVEVPCHDGPVTQTLEHHRGVPHPFGRPQAEVHADDGDGRQAGAVARERDGRGGIPPRPVGEADPEATPAHVVDDHPRRGQDRRPARAETATVPEQATGAGERREPELGREPARHLLQAQHVGGHGAHHPGGGRAVVPQVVHVVRHDPQHVLAVAPRTRLSGRRAPARRPR